MMHHKGYRGCAELDQELGVWRGEVIGVSDVITFEGATEDDVQQAFCDSVDDYLDFCKQRGEEPDR